MRTTSRYTGLRALAPGPYNDRAEVSARELLNALDPAVLRVTYEHVVVQGERIDQLAYRKLGDSRLWWMLADLNPHVDPLFLLGGDVLRVPRVDQIL